MAAVNLLMDAVMANYVDPGFRYVSSQVPGKVQSREQALAGGLNCITLAHLVIQDMFSYSLPSHFQATELSADDEHFETVRDTESMVSGDLLWFGTSEPIVQREEFVPRFADDELLNFDEFPHKPRWYLHRVPAGRRRPSRAPRKSYRWFKCISQTGVPRTLTLTGCSRHFDPHRSSSAEAGSDGVLIGCGMS